ncbi:hypothetical protein GGG87_05595 [Streptococcus sp. zg-86]|uniref:MORN repeat protein n=1 Tax=Streptococcus zhangguiae TaxID=2664091 RepID=A0A6I4RAB3_9STRE|nr:MULTISPECIES: hypothetical protein [unclassified Streptococcus]MTB64462.1 hypothetical protein [Streptococcus sp. zg-86]MTB90848.1 hypothetical protein [Streptococcus sp. zg-36]MWV56449.1 hypothetical protein [Streptococcus sp. zg-70]QTH47344.1 hypothetical protein J5M87_07210 [Streptococcus sp. zg-86]
MNQLLDYLQKLDLKDTKSYLTRSNIEKASIVFILLCALSVFLGRIPAKQTLNLDNGKMTYQGTLVANKMSGQGSLTFENGDKYKGEFKNGIFNGKGTYVSATGWTYEGEFKNGIADGNGKLTTESNVIYEGRFKQGIYQYAN